MTAVMFRYITVFFQAEDGIRFHCVTGVQTCALPISARSRAERRAGRLCLTGGGHLGRDRRRRAEAAVRSEERRVGKECRYWWVPYQEQEMNSMRDLKLNR